ncbi:MAG: uracil-DNA glycosylase [Paracoccaceae bacterium]|nr:uracil-DNA glycosylase [Paracoccaceae bacterium]
MESQLDWHNARALLEWQVDLGATEAIQEQPVDRFALDPAPVKAPKIMPSVAKPPAAPQVPAIDSVAIARGLAEQSQTLEELAAAIGGFELCDLRKGARNLVFGEGQTGCDVMIIGDVPGREDDLHGKPFLGPSGQLLDKMLGAIGLSRPSAATPSNVYLAPFLPWRPPQSRRPSPAEIAMMAPFMRRHIVLAAPKTLVLMGGIACDALLGKSNLTDLRGQWFEFEGIPLLPMLSPGYLLRMPSAKKSAWKDLLTLKKRLELE